MPLSDWVKIFGSDKSPTAERNRYAAPIQTSGRRLAVNTLDSLRTDIPNAFNTYMAGQGRQEALAGQQEGVLNTLLGRQLAYDPAQSLRDTFQTAFSQIDPNLVSRISAGDAARSRLHDMAIGRLAGVDSTTQRLRDAAAASRSYYDLARNVYNVVPTLFNSVYQQGIGSNQAAAGYVPGISAAYEAVANRPYQGILNRINAARQGQGIESQGIANALAATQGYKQHQNWADKIGGALGADEKTAMDLAKMALSFYTGGLAGGGGGGGGGMGSLMSMFGGGGGGQPGGTPAYGSQYPGAGGMYYSAPQYGGGGFSAPMT
jgi:hypothetical protein